MTIAPLKSGSIALLFAAAVYAQVFDYDKTAPLNFTQKEKDNRDGVRLYSCSFDIAQGKVAGYLVTPAQPGPHPAIIWMHSSGALNWAPDAMLLARAGAVSLIVDAPGGGTGDGTGDGEAFRKEMIGAVVAIRRAVDVLETRPDVDPKRIAYAGHSYGAMMGADAVSVDGRFRAAVFEVGLLEMDVHIATSPHPWAAGVRKELGDKLPAFLKAVEILNTSHYLPNAPRIPLLFQAARYDPGVPEKDTLDFYNIANQPKELKWYATGHDVSDIAAISDRTRFLGRHLGLTDIERVLMLRVQQGLGGGSGNTVVVISLDGFPAYALENDKVPIPALRRMMVEGAWAKRMSTINPTVTWPNHTTLVTGVDARKHGVLFNGLLKRDVFPPKLEPWVDKEKWVRSHTVYDAAFEAGMTTAQVNWPAIYNAKTISWQFPEMPDPDGTIEREMEERGILSRQDAAAVGVKSHAAWRDAMWTAAAAHIIREHHPNLLLFHLLNLDGTHHEYGPGTAASYSAIAYADTRIEQILDALKAAGMKERSTVIVVSDHGFKKVKRNIRPNAVLRQAGLGDRAHIMVEGGLAMLYANRPIGEYKAAFRRVEGIDHVVEERDYASVGLPTRAENIQAPDLVLVARPGYAFAEGENGEPVVDAPPGNGQHGYLNTDPDMDGIFIACGRGIRAGARAERIRNIDVAPTIAALLGLEFKDVDGRPLAEFLAIK